MKSSQLIILLTIIVMPYMIQSAPRKKVRPACSSCAVNKPLQRNNVVEKPKQLSEAERDQQMFMGFLGIISSFIKLFIDPQNIPEAKQNATNIVNGVYQLAHIITRRSLTPMMQSRLMEYIVEYCKANQIQID